MRKPSQHGCKQKEPLVDNYFKGSNPKYCLGRICDDQQNLYKKQKKTKKKVGRDKDIS